MGGVACVGGEQPHHTISHHLAASPTARLRTDQPDHMARRSRTRCDAALLCCWPAWLLGCFVFVTGPEAWITGLRNITASQRTAALLLLVSYRLTGLAVSACLVSAVSSVSSYLSCSAPTVSVLTAAIHTLPAEPEVSLPRSPITQPQHRPVSRLVSPTLHNVPVAITDTVSLLPRSSTADHIYSPRLIQTHAPSPTPTPPTHTPDRRDSPPQSTQVPPTDTHRSDLGTQESSAAPTPDINKTYRLAACTDSLPSRARPSNST